MLSPCLTEEGLYSITNLSRIPEYALPKPEILKHKGRYVNLKELFWTAKDIDSASGIIVFGNHLNDYWNDFIDIAKENNVPIAYLASEDYTKDNIFSFKSDCTLNELMFNQIKHELNHHRNSIKKE